MRELKESWEFAVVGIANYRKTGWNCDKYLEFIKKNHDKLPGDLVECGVYRGNTLLAVAMLLKELGSDKHVWGYDTFSGFPPVYAPEDKLEKFDELLAGGVVTQEHYDQAMRNLKLREYMVGAPINAGNISTSGAFTQTSEEIIRHKAEYLGLDNFTLMPGCFGDTMKVDSTNGPKEIFACLMDCDLYQSHMDALPFAWDRLVPGGLIFLDEYYSLKFPGARIAINSFFKDKADQPELLEHLPTEFERWGVRKIHSS